MFLYITYVVLAVVQVGLFRTRWGPRTRAIGEHPLAADTVGIWVIAMQYRNVIIAGIGGAYFTIGSVGSFGIDMSSGEGYIALAATIFGRYTPFGAIGGRCCSASPRSCSRSCPASTCPSSPPARELCSDLLVFIWERNHRRQRGPRDSYPAGESGTGGRRGLRAARLLFGWYR